MLASLGAAFALFVVAVFEVYDGGEWYWFLLLATSYPAALYGAARLGRMDGAR